MRKENNTKSLELKIGGMTCAACAKAVERLTKKLDGVEKSNVNIATEKASIEYDSSKVKVSDIKSVIEKAGYSIIEENKKTLVNAVCNMENSRYIYVFAKYIKGLSELNKKALKSAILSLNDTEFIDRYALYVDESIIFEKYGTIENFHMHLNEVENNKKDSILKHKKYVYKI